MESKLFCWTVGYSARPEIPPAEMYPAVVPGAVQLDYARAKQWPSYLEGTNFQEYAWMEDVYWLYRTALDFSVTPEQSATLVFEGIDYRYQIRIDGAVAAAGEGMFTPVRIDITRFAGSPHVLEVLIYPVPKADDSQTRSQARLSCKPAACYGWDWHPRLVSSGLFRDVKLLIRDARHIETLDAGYTLSDDLCICTLHARVSLAADCTVRVRLLDGQTVAAEETRDCCAGETAFTMTVEDPKLWYPIGFGPQHRYTLSAAAIDGAGCVLAETVRRIGFRRSRLVMNEGGWERPRRFPKSRSDAPATLELNGRRIFAKGSNWVNAHIFPGALTDADYASLLSLAEKANMNLLRVWGGGFVNHEAFFELCDEKGIMVWQEFPLACNEYPDDPHYLSVLEREATSIVRRLRTHPCLVLWCGGNELFNGWSQMTEQHHALRLLDKVCYTEDRCTPFIMTSPLNGMGHGHYLNYDETTGEEFITALVHSDNTAYPEFGSPAAASPAYIRRFLSEEDYRDCTASNAAWRGHHAFLAWQPGTWLRFPEVEYYFGGYSDFDDFCRKSQFLQAMCYRSYFEEMRKQWPRCAMALNWCFNEPWPTVANNSLLSWPDIPKPGYEAVKAALRPQLASLRIDRHLWNAGELFRGEVWVLNDSLADLPCLTVEVSYAAGKQDLVKWGTLQCLPVPAQRNRPCGEVIFPIPGGLTGEITVSLAVAGRPDMDSEYRYLCRAAPEASPGGTLNL